MARKLDIDSLLADQEEIESINDTASHLADPNPVAQTDKEHIGAVDQFFSKLGVAAIKLTGSLSAGDVIEIGTEDDAIRQRVESMQIDNENVESAAAGDDIGIKLKHVVKVGSDVYKVKRQE